MGSAYSREECDLFWANIGRTPGEPVWYERVELDGNGCRKLPPLPDKNGPAAHPRLFFTRADIPSLVARLTHSPLGPQLAAFLEQGARNFAQRWDSLPNELPADVDRGTAMKEPLVLALYDPDEFRVVDVLVAYVHATLHGDVLLIKRTIQFALAMARAALRHRTMRSQIADWDRTASWRIGGAAFALLYDLMASELDAEQKALMRECIVSVVNGRISWGAGLPTRRTQSNWGPYNSDILCLYAVVEGDARLEAPDMINKLEDLMVHFMDFAVYDSGHPVEDCYALNLALREGSFSFLCMALRGFNIFNHPKYKKIFTQWLPYALEPNGSGRVYGGSSGSEWVYPTSAIIAKYMFPQNKAVDTVYRTFMAADGKPLGRLSKIQSRLAAILFALPPGNLPHQDDIAPQLPVRSLDFICRDRGKVIMLSDTASKCASFTLDARPDAFLIGHDSPSRGSFTYHADGRTWALCPEWKVFGESSHYSLPLINQQGQLEKAPSVKLLNVRPDKNSCFAACDLTYAYNYCWSSWGNRVADWKEKGYEPEMSDPRDFGFEVWWAPRKLYCEPNVAFMGLDVVRKRIANVRQVTRSVLFVRLPWPFAIIADDVLKDGHNNFTWSMTTPPDVRVVRNNGNEAVLQEDAEAGRRFVVRSLYKGRDLQCLMEPIVPTSRTGDGKAKQLQFCTMGPDARFKFIMFHVGIHDVPLETRWNSSGVLEVLNPKTGELRLVRFGVGHMQETTMSLDELP